MKFFIDSADIFEIKKAQERGWVDGVTTNPSLVSKVGRPFREIIQEIAATVSGPVSAEVISLEANEMYLEAKNLVKIADNIVIKIPMTEAGMIAVKRLSSEGIKTNVTLVFSPVQALLAAKAGASMVSPFVGRLDDVGVSGMGLVSEIIDIFRNYNFETEVLVASIRSIGHIQQAAQMGADIATIPFKVMQQMAQHPLTDKGIQIFMEDWSRSQKK